LRVRASEQYLVLEFVFNLNHGCSGVGTAFPHLFFQHNSAVDEYHQLSRNGKGARLFGLAVSVTGHFNRDICVHKELMKFVKFVNVNEYLGRIIIYPYNTRQIKTRQFTLPKTRSNSGAKMIKYSAIEISPKFLQKLKI